MTDNAPFRTRLEHAVNARHSRMNPFTERWVNGELTRAQLASWANRVVFLRDGRLIDETLPPTGPESLLETEPRTRS